MAACRLVYFILTRGTIGWTEDVFIQPGYRSDHSVIGIVLEPIEIERGPGCWKFNNMLIEDKLNKELELLRNEQCVSLADTTPRQKYIECEIENFFMQFRLRDVCSDLKLGGKRKVKRILSISMD